MHCKHLSFFITVFFLIFVFVTQSFAGAGYVISTSGAPARWDNSAAIEIHPESGVCGSFSNAQMLTKLATNLAEWSNLDEVDIQFDIVSGEIGGVDGCNYGDYLANVTGSTDTTASLSDGLNPILFDDNGDIVASVAGTANRFRVLGFASPAGFTSDYSEIVDGQAVFNCRCLAGNSNGACTSGSSTTTFSEDDLNFTMTHELGHFINLDHTQVNCTTSSLDVTDDSVHCQDSDGDDVCDNLCDNASTSDDDDIPAMYPVSENAGEQISPMQDDIVALAGLYPADTFTATYCHVTGTLLDSSGNELRCADVQATTDDPADSVAFVSGAYAVGVDNNGDLDSVDDGECTSGCGDFELHLTPGKSYTVHVEPINSSFTSGSGISPCANDQLDTIVSEVIASISAQCTAGATVNLGNITTDSTGGVDASESAALVKALSKTTHNEFFGQNYSAEDLRFTMSLAVTTDCVESDANEDDSSSTSSGCSCLIQNRPVSHWYSSNPLVWLFLALPVFVLFSAKITARRR